MDRHEEQLILKNEFQKAKFTLSDRQVEQFLLYYEYLTEKNKVMNLTAITEYQEVVLKHFIDSVLLTHTTDLTSFETLIDVGTGAGFPGIPLKIVFPHLKITLLDSLNKRVIFMREVIEKLGLTGITAVHGRAEDIARDPIYREKYDLCVSRAVANLSILSEYCLPFVKRNGMFISYKSSDIQQEVEAARKAIYLLGGKIRTVKKTEIPETDIVRAFVVVEKINGTPAKYPRKAGLPVKNPIQ